uniref:Uncharacterized protein n=1 Tax=Anguilla anguilla TaxID=7936 RepID=A0A0E9PNK6_ANGAN
MSPELSIGFVFHKILTFHSAILTAAVCL